MRICNVIIFLVCIYLLAVDKEYERAEERTYLPMLIQVSLFFPLLIGLVLLYPWISEVRKKDDSLIDNYVGVIETSE